MAKKKKRDHSGESEKLVPINKNETKENSIFSLISELVAGILFGLSIFTIFITLRLTKVIEWHYWWIFSPIWVVLFILLILTQSRRISTHMPVIARIVWLICLISILAFLVLLNIFLEKELDPGFALMFSPLWVLIGSSFLLGISGIGIALFCTKHEKKAQKYLLAGLGMLFFDVVFFPFFLMMELKLSKQKNLEWSAVFIPLWVLDGFFLCAAFILLLFTVGSRESATFSLSQVITFLFVLPTSAVFKLLLVIYLDGDVNNISLYWIMAPLILMELLVFSCGLNFRCTKKSSQQPTSMV